jgi:hypothetical protein
VLSSVVFDDREMGMLHNSSRREIALATTLVGRVVAAEGECTPIHEAGAE